MIGSRRGLVVLAAIALALMGALVLDVARAPAAVTSRALLPGAAEGAVQRLAWTRADTAVASVERVGDAWMIAGSPVRADAATVDAVLATLRGGRWQRRGEVALAGTVRETLAVNGAWRIGRGDDLAGGEQTWLVVGEHGVLVDAWVARALFPEPGQLRVSAPFAEVSGRVTITRGDAVVELDLSRAELLQPTALVLAPAQLAAVREALAALVVTRWLPAPLPAGGDWAVASGARRVELRGACPGAPELAAAHTDAGDGCIESAPVAALERLVALLSDRPEALADPRPLATRPLRLVLMDGAILELAKQPQLGVGQAHPVDVDPGRLAALLAALRDPGVLVPLPAGAPRGALVADGRTLDVWADGAVARRGEAVAVRVAPAALASLLAPSAALREAALWADEPTAISEVVIDGVRYRRGAVIGEWTRGTSSVRDPQLDALVDAIAAPRSTGGDQPPAAAAGSFHRLEMSVRPPVGAEIHRGFQLEAVGKRCALRAAEGAAWISPPACAAVSR